MKFGIECCLVDLPVIIHVFLMNFQSEKGDGYSSSRSEKSAQCQAGAHKGRFVVFFWIGAILGR